MKIMSEAEIPAFVQAVLKIGCTVEAVGDRRYVFGDGDLSNDAYARVAPQLERILTTFGRRDHLTSEIAIYLRALDRYVDP